MKQDDLVALAVFAGFVLVVVGILRYMASRQLSRQLLRFVGARSVDELHWVHASHPGPHRVDFIRAVTTFLPTLGLTVTQRGLHGLVAWPVPVEVTLDNIMAGRFTGTFGSVGRERLKTGPVTLVELPTEALHLCAGGPARLVLHVAQPEILDPGFRFSGFVRDTPEAVAWVNDLMTRIEEWAMANSVFRGQLIRPVIEDGPGIEFVEAPSMEGVHLPQELLTEIDENLLSFDRNREVLARLGIQTHRGLLLCGEPGTGKTSTCRYLRQKLPDHTFLLVSAKLLHHMKELFGLARRLAPSVVIIEDVDLVAGSRETNYTRDTLGDLLNQMDGLEDRDRIHVVLTSNSWRCIEKALADRPGRVDHITFFEPPDAGHRRVLLERFTERLERRADLDSLVASTDGLTPAQLKELVKKATILALARDGACGKEPTLFATDFQRALEVIRQSPLSGGRRKSRSKAPGRPTILSLESRDPEPPDDPRPTE